MRDLTELEKEFIEEAKAGHFMVLIHEEKGYPYAMGAPGTSNLFSMEVEEKDDPYNRGSIYLLPECDRPAPAHNGDGQ